MTIQIFDKTGVISLAAIDPAEVSRLDDGQQSALAVLIAAVEARESAQTRYTKATAAVRDATLEQHDALAAHVLANPPQTEMAARAAAVAAFNASNETGVSHGL